MVWREWGYHGGMTSTASLTRVLAGGLIVEVDCTGRTAPAACSWLVQVPTASLYPPEAEWYPDSPSDVYTVVDCGARLFDDGHGSYHCEAGHRHVSFEDPDYPAYEAELAWQERRAEGAWS